MDTITLYRIEKDGIGPFCHPERYENEYLDTVMNDLGIDKTRHPVPFDDRLIKKWTIMHCFPNYMQCATISLESLEDWFCGAFDALAGAEFAVAEVTIAKQHVVIGETQVIFDSTQIIKKMYRAIPEVFTF